MSGNKNFTRIKVREYLSWLSAITSKVSLLVTVEAFAILSFATVLASLTLGVLSLLRRKSIARVSPWSIILALRSFWCARIIVSHIATPRFCSFNSFTHF